MEPLLTGEGLGDIKALNFGIAISPAASVRGKGTVGTISYVCEDKVWM